MNSYEENVKAILQCCFSQSKEELIENAVKAIMALKQESITINPVNPVDTPYIPVISIPSNPFPTIPTMRLVIRGKWEDCTKYNGEYRCSICKEFEGHKRNFCPNCGADMRGINE